MTVTYTSAGATFVAAALQSNGALVAPTHAAFGLGCGTLASALSSGTPYTALSLATGLPAALAVGQSLTLLDASGDTQVVTVAAPAPSAGATSIPVLSFTPTATFAVGSGVMPTPSVTDTALFDETWREVVDTTAGGSPGVTTTSAYMDPSAPTATYLEIGFYGGTATSALGSGTLMARGTLYIAHTFNVDSATYTMTSTLSLT